MKKILLLLALCFSAPLIFAQNPLMQAKAVESLFSHYTVDERSGISVLVIRDGDKIFNRSFGFAEISAKRKATNATNYRIASVTKSFTAMAVLMLRDQGKLKLEDPLSSFFPGLPSFAGEITVKEMINHTSGLKSYGDAPKGTTFTDMDILRVVEKQDSTKFVPGSRFSYSNTAYVLLGLIVQKVSGLSLADFVRRNIFVPLKMKNSTFNNREGKIINRAYGYNLRNGKLVLEDQSDASYLQGDGGIYSSIDDFYHWDQALYSDKLLSRKTMDEIFSPSSTEAVGLDYGYGWYIENRFGTKRVSHSGGTTGFSSYYVRYPEKKFSIVIFANQNEGLALDPIIMAIERIYLQN
jgi:CubicO group peptidase (beta-lactamase class C family)